MGFTFKKEKPETGLASVGRPNPDTQIKLNKKQVGYIRAPIWSDDNRKWIVRFAFKDGNSFTWKQLKGQFDTEEDARKFIQYHAEKFLTWPLYSLED
jgi:hypothetical protein